MTIFCFQKTATFQENIPLLYEYLYLLKSWRSHYLKWGNTENVAPVFSLLGKTEFLLHHSYNCSKYCWVSKRYLRIFKYLRIFSLWIFLHVKTFLWSYFHFYFPNSIRLKNTWLKVLSLFEIHVYVPMFLYVCEEKH